jgi:carbon-monoxide dehydrogenase medium subunit
MYPAPFEYHAPESLEEAVALLGRHGEEAKLIAGGHSLLPLMKLRFAQPAHLIDLRRVPGLAGIREEGDTVVIGAMTTHRMVEQSEVVRRRLPLLAEAAGVIGDPLVRNAGTIGGSLAHADPGADLPAVMLALDAEMHAVGANQGRILPAEDFFVGLLASALEPSEVLREVRIPVPSGRTGGAYEKRPHPASRYALVGVAAQVTLGDGSAISDVRVALTGVGVRAVRARSVEQALTGQRADGTIIAEAARLATEGLEPREDLQGSADYKLNLAVVHAKRAIQRAAGD